METFAELPEVWRAIYGAGPGFLSLFSGARPEPGAKLTTVRETYFAWPREMPSALSWIAREAGEDRELYQCSHLTTRWRRRKEDAAPLTSLYVDLDALGGAGGDGDDRHDDDGDDRVHQRRAGGDGEPHAGDARVETPKMIIANVISFGGVIPSVTVESSPGHYQAYFRLARPVRPEVGEALNRRLAHALGADPSGFDLTQLLRIPGTVNHKYEERPAVRLLALQDVAYPPEDLEELLPRLPVMPRTRGDEAHLSALPPVGSEPPIPLTRSARALWDGQSVKFTPAGEVDRSGSLVRICRLLYQAGVPRELIVAALAERDESLGWSKYTGRGNAAEQYHRLVDLVERGAPTRRSR